jgi:hypothetical protein
MTRPSLRVPLAAAGIAALFAVPAVAGAVTIPNLPGVPTVPPKLAKSTVYPVTIDVAGYLKVKVTKNYARECSPGRDTLAEFEADFELGTPRPATVIIQNGVVSSTGVLNTKRRGAGAVHTGSFVVNRETNNCAPTPRVELAPPPTCKPRLSGRLRAFINPRPEDSGDITPLVRGVNIVLSRTTGGTQSVECMSELPSLSAKIGEDATALSPMEIAKSAAIAVPIGTDVQFLRLKKGKSIRRSIGLGGACNGVILSGAAAQTQDGYTCTVKGRIVVNIKRTR